MKVDRTTSEPRRWGAASPSRFVALRLRRPLGALPPAPHHRCQKEARTRYRASEDAGQPRCLKDDEDVGARWRWATSIPPPRAQKCSRKTQESEDPQLGAAMAKQGIKWAGRARNSLSVVHLLHLRHVILPLSPVSRSSHSHSRDAETDDREMSLLAYIRLRLKCEETWAMGRWDDEPARVE